MGSIVNYDEKCRCCGLDAMFRDCYYDTGEYFESCSVCGYFSRFFMKNTGAGLVRDKFVVPLSKVRIQIKDFEAWNEVAMLKLPQGITFKELNILAWGNAEKWLPVLRKYGLSEWVDPQKHWICIGYYTKGKKRKFRRMDLVGNDFKLAKTRNPKSLIFYQVQFDDIYRPSFGAMCVKYAGKRKTYTKCFRSKPNIDKLLKKWNKLTETPYDEENSYLMVVEDGKAKYLKGRYRYMYDEEGESKIEQEDRGEEDCGSGTVFDSCEFEELL